MRHAIGNGYVTRMVTRIADPDLIEHRLLELAYTSDVKITATALAYFAPCSIDAAQRVLDRLSAEERVQMEIEDDGTVVYHVPARAKLALAPPVLTRELMPVQQHQPSPTLAVVLAALFPGAGHFYAGRIAAGVLWFFAITAGYLLLVPGLLIQLASMVSAAHAAQPRYHATT